MLGTRPCEREPDVLAAAAGERMPAEIEAHVAGCDRCRDALTVAGFMRRMADTSAARAQLPDPGTLWWKAQIVRRWEAERRSAAPVESMERVELLAAIVAIVLGAFWGLPGIWRSLTGAAAVDTDTVARVALTFDPAQLATYIGVALAVIAAGTFYLVHRTLFSDY